MMQLELRLNRVADAGALARFHAENLQHLQPWEPRREHNYHTEEFWRQRLKDRTDEFAAGTSAHFISYNRAADEVIATCSLTGIARGPFQAAIMGYSAAKRHEGRGHTRELCEHVIAFAFEELGLNRIMANYMPGNRRSEGLLNRLGFEREGFARRYLFINGKWEDHVLTSLVNPDLHRGL